MNKIEQTRQRLLKSGRKIINLSSGNPNEFGIYFDRAVLKKSYEKFLRAPAYEPDPKGSLLARGAVQKFYATRGLKINPGQIILTSGSSESYFHLFKMLARPGEKVLFPRPSYPLFEEIARLAEVETGFYNLDENDGWQIDCENLESKIRADVKAMVLVSPNNPTGAVLSQKTLERVAEIAVKHNLPVISDEVFSEYIFSGKDFPRMAQIAKRVTQKNTAGPTVFTLNGISKTYALPGLKLSWIVATGANHAQYIDQLERSADAFLACNQVSQAMLPDIIKNGRPFIKSLNQHLQKNRDMAVKILGANPNITFHVPEGGFYLFARISGQAGSCIRTIWDSARMEPAEGNRGRGPSLTEAGSIPAFQPAIHSFKSTSLPTDEDFVIALMEKKGIFVHPGYFYDYDKGINILISLLPPTKTLTQKLKILAGEVKPK